MSALCFDTLAFANRLKAAGVGQAQAEAQAEALGEVVDHHFGALATKDDLRHFPTKEDLRSFATKDDLRHFPTKDDLRHFPTKDDLRNFATKDDLRGLATIAQLHELEQRLTIRLGAMLVVAVGALAALVRIGV